MLRQTIALASAFTAPVSLMPGAAQAQSHFTAADMTITPGPGGSVSTAFGQTGIVAGMFEHVYQFVLPTNGLASGSVSTRAVIFEGAGDLDLISVAFNGIPLGGRTDARNEAVFADLVPVTADAVNRIVISGLSRGNGAYAGQGSFAPLAVPEPAAWAMLIGGFGFAGLSLRRHRAQRRAALA